MRGWLCASDYTDCARSPETASATDQQGHAAEAASVAVSGDAPRPFALDWRTSPSSVDGGDSFTLTVRMYDVRQSGEHGGISVSFPSITQAGGGNSRHASAVADVQAVSYDGGLSNVTFHQPGATIYARDGVTQLAAKYLLV